MKFGKRLLAPTLLVLLFLALLIQLPGMAQDRRDAYAWFDPIQDILKIVSREYVENIDDQKLQALQLGAIDGMLKSLDDPYTEFIPAQQLKEFEKTTGGTYVGIGAEVRMVNGWLTIASPMAGSPALEAGIRAGDQVREIDGTTTKGEPIDESVNRLMGEEGKSVSVKVHRQDAPDDELTELTIKRRRIEVATVEGVHRDGEGWDYYLDREAGLAYVRVTQFTGTTADDLAATMSSLVKTGLKGAVLDLRFDPGGRLDAAIEVADLFLPTGRIVTIKGRTNPAGHWWDAQKEGTLPDFPLVVLVNGQSASASEIVAGALKDNNRAVIIGTRSFGKGKVQDVKRDLPSGAGWLKITTAYYYLPSGNNIQRLPDSTTWGVDPTDGFYVPMLDAEYRRMLIIQRELDIIRTDNGQGDWGDAKWIQERLKDPQLSAAVEALRLRLADGTWHPTGKMMDANAEALAELGRAQRQRDLLAEQLERTDKEIEQLLAFVPAETDTLPDLLPSNMVLAGGTIEVKDASGKVVATLQIADQDNLEAALLRAGVKPVEKPAPVSPTPGTNNN